MRHQGKGKRTIDSRKILSRIVRILRYMYIKKDYKGGTSRRLSGALSCKMDSGRVSASQKQMVVLVEV